MNRYKVEPRYVLGLQIPDEYVVWENRRQLCVTHSRSDAEYIAAALGMLSLEQTHEVLTKLEAA